MTGDTVTVLRPRAVSEDSLGNATVSWDEEAVGNVLFGPSSTDGVTDSTRPAGTSRRVEFHFPKAYTQSLRGCLIRHAGHTYRVIGDPAPYMDSLTPGDWNRPVTAEEVDG